MIVFQWKSSKTENRNALQKTAGISLPDLREKRSLIQESTVVMTIRVSCLIFLKIPEHRFLAEDRKKREEEYREKKNQTKVRERRREREEYYKHVKSERRSRSRSRSPQVKSSKFSRHRDDSNSDMSD